MGPLEEQIPCNESHLVDKVDLCSHVDAHPDHSPDRPVHTWREFQSRHKNVIQKITIRRTTFFLKKCVHFILSSTRNYVFT